MSNRILVLVSAFLIILIAIPRSGLCVMKYNGIQPGLTSKDETDQILGAPTLEISQKTFEYKPATLSKNTEKISIEYKQSASDTIVDKIDVYFIDAIPKSDLARKWNLPESPYLEGKSPDGKLQEYYGSTKSLVLTFNGKTVKSGIRAISYLSPDKFQSLVGELADSKESGSGNKKEEENSGNNIENKKGMQQEVVAKYAPEAKQHLQQGMIYVSLVKANNKTKSENYNNALLEFSKAIELSPNYAEAYSDRGVIYMQQKKYNKAEYDLKKAEQLKPKDPIILYNLTALYSLEKKNDLALDYLGKALENGFNNYDALKPSGKDSDPDLANLRKDPEFKKVLEKHKVFILK